MYVIGSKQAWDIHCTANEHFMQSSFILIFCTLRVLFCLDVQMLKHFQVLFREIHPSNFNFIKHLEGDVYMKI